MDVHEILHIKSITQYIVWLPYKR